MNELMQTTKIYEEASDKTIYKAFYALDDLCDELDDAQKIIENILDQESGV